MSVKKDISKKKHKTGIIRVNSKPMGFLSLEEGRDAVVYEENLNCALDRDEVTFEMLKGDKARVLKVLKRNKTEFVCVLEKKQYGPLLAIPSDHRFYRPIELYDYDKAAASGLKALVKMDNWNNSGQNPKGKIIKIIGEKGEHETEMQSILLDKGIVYDFPKEVEEEAGRVAENFSSEKFSAERRDFRDVTTFTIDPVDAKDFDDALSYKDIDNNTIEVGVHIADVSHFVRPGSALDQEARKRSFSTYLVDRTIPMLPEVLSNNLCSLNPNVDRFAFGAVFEINKETGEILNRWFGKTIINSDKRFTYEEAQEVLNKKEGNFVNELIVLNTLANIYRKENKKNGAIEFETEEVKFELDTDGKPVRIYKKPRLDTMKMIEEWMLLANREVAKFISNKLDKSGGASIYRVHDLPNEERIEELSIFVRALGHELKINGGEITAKDINLLLAKIEGHSAESLVKTAAVRSMAKAVYSTKNIGHFGLAFEYYTHFTSPIRRYADLMIHRILENHLKGGKIAKDEYARFERIAVEASDREIKVQEAERESIKYKQVEYMREKVGEEFECVISGVTEWGMYLEEPNTKAEGLVRLKDIEGDTYELDSKNYAIVGKITKKKFTLGDRVKARLSGADLDRKTLDFKLV